MRRALHAPIVPKQAEAVAVDGSYQLRVRLFSQPTRA
jgi:hypothetical protein